MRALCSRLQPSRWRPAVWQAKSVCWGSAVQRAWQSSSSSAAAPVARWPNSLVTLAIETSCDDTCVAVLEKERGAARARLLFEGRITADNRAFGGIHPLTATEAHTAALAPLVQRAVACLSDGTDETDGGRGGNGYGCRRPGKPDFVSVTRGPGMASSLATGLAVAKGLAVAWDVPLVGVHHMQAHALTPRLVAATTTDDDAADDAGGGGSGSSGSSGSGRPVRPSLPYLSLLVSGGHTLLVHSRSLTDHRILAAAANIAVGDLLDKCARAILPAGYIAAAEAAAGRSLPYGGLLERFAGEEEEDSGGSGDTGNNDDYTYPAARRDEMAPFDPGRGWRLEAPLGAGALRKVLRFDFSGLNGSVIKLAEADGDNNNSDSNTFRLPDEDRRLLARGTMRLAFEHLASRLLMALERLKAEAETGTGTGTETDAETHPPLSCLVVAGGVASNQFLRRVLRSALDVRGYGHLPLVAPPPALCTDNAAMIAWAGMEMFEAGWQTELTVLPRRKWSMDAAAEDGGILGAPGWTKR